jgi:hypothetical protein
MAEKSLVEEALLEAKAIEESVKKSAKEILPSVLKKEINELVKESINDIGEIDIDSETLDITDEDDMDMDMAPMGDMDMDMDSVELDLTASSDDEVMKVFKKMGPEDEIEVVKTGDGVTLTDGNEEYEIKNVSEGKEEPIYEIELDGDGESKGDQSATRSDYKNYKGTDKGYEGKDGSSHGEQGKPDDYMNEMKDETMYEIELDDFEGEEDLEEASMGRSFAHGAKASSGSPKGLKKASTIPNKARYKKEVNESRKTPRNPNTPRVIKENKKLRESLGTYGTEVKKLRSKNEEYKKALSLFREKLNEVAVFNSNLAYTTKLFTEHTTTKKEKLNILSRFDEINSLKESKSLYKKLTSEFGTKKPIQEAITSKGGTKVISEGVGNNKNKVIKENKVYQDPQMTRMMDLMNKIK